MEMLDEPSINNGEVYLSFNTKWEPNTDEIRSLSKKYPKGTLMLTFEEGNEDFFGAAVSKNGSLYGVGISESISITGTKYDWMKTNHPELLADFDNDDDIEDFILFEFPECDEYLEWDNHYQNILQEMLDNSLTAVNNNELMEVV